jgi:hypothetical protein
LAARWWRAITDVITADNENSGIRPPCQDFWQGTHEDVITPMGLQVAADEGNHLLISRKEPTRSNGQAHPWIGRCGGRINAVVGNRDPAPEILGEGVGLPLRGRQTCIGNLEMRQIVKVLQTHPTRCLDRPGRKLRVEADIAALSTIEIFAIDAKLRMRPDLFEKQALAPARMGDDDIGHKALRFERQRGSQAAFGAYDLAFQVNQPGVQTGSLPAPKSIANDPDALPVACDVAQGQRYYPMSAAHQCRRKMLELPWKVLMNKQKVHARDCLMQIGLPDSDCRS